MGARKKPQAPSTTQAQAELRRLEAQRQRLRKAFPTLPRKPRLIDQYGSPEERQLFNLDRQIAALKLNLIHQGASFSSFSRASRAPKPRGRAQAGLRPPAPKDFNHSEDYRSVAFHGGTYTLTSRQAQVVQLLHEAQQRGQALSQDYILEKLETPASRLRDTFKESGLWGTLIVRGEKRGMYRLNVKAGTS